VFCFCTRHSSLDFCMNQPNSTEETEAGQSYRILACTLLNETIPTW
jgi:hypothetical protein